MVKEDFEKQIINGIKEYGPYILISDGVAFPHAGFDQGASKTGFSFIRLKKPISFTEDKSEVLTAYNNKSDIIKIFPVSNVCESYFNDLKAPLGEFPIMAVGGVNSENAKEYFNIGAQYIGLGGVFSKEALKENDLNKMKKECMEFEKQIFNE